ncbi:uncharacterized protein HHUB_2156 [Halobacterium hubeiense]|uniref:Uncharacterized protein n=1 Tax=Halobacterium hubeiense TaxID=1407499 RepID=A0A0U5CXJ8_9EURY|nr:hypothetical protein [Halobacterium hubeiense]CQH54945.1 uncharacterized protein HHUB_2156 [Halobacterium hubeiense]
MAPSGDPDADETVLSPDELDIEAREEVASIGEDRYVIGPDGPPDTPETDDNGDSTDDATSDGDDTATEPDQSDIEDADETPEQSATSDDTDAVEEITGRDVKRWLVDELDEHDSEYAYRIAAKSGDSVNHQQLATDDIGAAFDGLLVWYAQQVAAGTPVDEALGILLSESSVQARYPTSRLVAYLEAHDLGPDDSIADLVETVSEHDGLVFPKRR